MRGKDTDTENLPEGGDPRDDFVGKGDPMPIFGNFTMNYKDGRIPDPLLKKAADVCSSRSGKKIGQLE